MINDTIKEVLKQLKSNLALCQTNADWNLKTFKEYEAKVLGLKETICELESHFGDHANGKKTE